MFVVLLVSYLLWLVYWRRRWWLNSRFITVTVCHTQLQNFILCNSSSTFLLHPIWLQRHHRVARRNNSNREECKNILGILAELLYRYMHYDNPAGPALSWTRSAASSYYHCYLCLKITKQFHVNNCVMWNWWWCKGF